jgi:CDP-diacylglycerol---serine O-phosphatidyltransferase
MHKTTPVRSRGIYLLPNLFTTAGIFLGYLAIVTAMKGHFSSAAIAIIVAMLTDALDGRIARLTDTQTAFGAEYDSLSDMVAFGIAPSLVVYTWALCHLGTLGWLISFLYTASTALRLARFNTQITVQDKRYFQGLACTAGAGIIASMVWVGHHYQLEGLTAQLFAMCVTIFVSVCMVSNIRYHSFKEVDFKGKVPFFTLLFIVLIFVGIAIDPPTISFVLAMGYGLSGPIQTLIYLRRARRLRKQRKLALKR